MDTQNLPPARDLKSRWEWILAVLAAFAGALSLAGGLQVLISFDVLPAFVEFDPAAFEMWKVLLDFAARITWPLVAGATVLLFAPQIRELIPRLIKFDTPFGSGELKPPDTSFEAGEVEGARKVVKEIASVARSAEVAHSTDALLKENEKAKTKELEANLDRKRGELYEPIYSYIGDLGNAILLRLQIEGDAVTSRNLARALGTSTETVNSTINRLLYQTLAWKQGPGIVARITQLGRAYLLWLRDERPEDFRRAQSLWQGPA